MSVGLSSRPGEPSMEMAVLDSSPNKCSQGGWCLHLRSSQSVHRYSWHQYNWQKNITIQGEWPLRSLPSLSRRLSVLNESQLACVGQWISDCFFIYTISLISCSKPGSYLFVTIVHESKMPLAVSWTIILCTTKVERILTIKFWYKILPSLRFSLCTYQ